MSTENQKWDVIFTYTTGEAVEDGSLILVDEKISKQAAINYPVYLTQAVFLRYVQVPRELKGLQDESGRLWDLLLMFTRKAYKNPCSFAQFLYFFC